MLSIVNRAVVKHNQSKRAIRKPSAVSTNSHKRQSKGNSAGKIEVRKPKACLHEIYQDRTVGKFFREFYQQELKDIEDRKRTHIPMCNEEFYKESIQEELDYVLRNIPVEPEIAPN
jgi:hypothetical protein